jgi:hypothetical protein
MVDPADTLPPRMAPVRIRPAEGGQGRVWRAKKTRSEPLSEPLVRRRGADYGELHTGPRLIPSLQRFFERRAGSAA